MLKHRSYTARVQPVVLRKWYWLELLLLFLFGAATAILLAEPGEGERWFLRLVYPVFFLFGIERLYKRYRFSKASGYQITIDEVGIRWKLPDTGNNQEQVIIWNDMRWLKWEEKRLLIVYTGTFFTADLPLLRISETDKIELHQLLTAYAEEHAINLNV